MKLLIVTQKVDPQDQLLGFFIGWITAFASQCDEVHVFCLEAQPITLPSNVYVHSLGKSDRKGKLVWLYRLFKYSFIYRKQYDCVFVHMNPIHVALAGIWWRLLGKRIGLWYTHPSVDFKLRLATFFSHVIFTGSESSFRVRTRKRNVMGQGVDPTFFTFKSNIDIQNPKLVVVGRISPIKNIEIALELLVLLRTESNATLHIVGGPSGTPEDIVYVQTLKEMVEKMAISEAVIWDGPKNARGVQNILQECDVFVHTSLTHSADKTLPEAMASGLFVVSSNQAYKDDLPSICFKEPEAVLYKESLDAYRQLTNQEQDALREDLRTCVEVKHSLQRLVKNILSLY
ncbi:MAG: glycosyltransferase involved in cell wall biosynthesis [Acidimicrobiales bacterium]|jgi:glycosyltransferase involved in cell wall biosynthesis